MENNLTTEKIPILIKRIAIPASIGFFFNTMYNVVDTYFAGLISTDALAALSISFPVFFIIIATGFGLSTGTTALISNALGANDIEKARKYSIQSVSFSAILGITLMILGFFISPFLFKILGAEGEYLRIAISYINIILMGAVFFNLSFVFNSILSSQGDTVSFRNYLIVGFLLNFILNPIFMFGYLGFPALGLTGIAWATFIIQGFGALYMGYRAMKTKMYCSTCYTMLKPSAKYFRKIAGQGFPASLSMLTTSIGLFTITYFISRFGSSVVAAYGIALRIDQIALLPGIGLNIATLTLIGQNNGAKLYERCGEIYKTTIKYSFFMATLGMLFVYIFASFLMGLFSSDMEVINVGVTYLRVSAFIYWAYNVLNISVASLQALKRPKFAIFIGVYRQIFFPFILYYTFLNLLDLGLYSIWWGIFTINWSAMIIALIYTSYTMKKVGQSE